ncbi:hypothetical protein DDZ13_03850 [Coraliomargarita sinensis]|uniref:Uncharacterized protein n=1 Tax=Coraliomargarita sinensis TaxID=2174842 RepID=A0A317ZHR3_9BACT|nr:hypothetical protein [Coraliomargarita sinensis]PXA05106.1 hypothetical protein DDZ13_03850 [Coraliomargarita sinensis]
MQPAKFQPKVLLIYLCICAAIITIWLADEKLSISAYALVPVIVITFVWILSVRENGITLATRILSRLGVVFFKGHRSLKSLPIVLLIKRERFKRALHATLYTGVANLIPKFAELWFNMSDYDPKILYAISSFLVLLIWGNYCVFYFRVKSGLYGMNFGEALEILKFIAQNSNNFDEGSPPGKVFEDVKRPASESSTPFGAIENA